MDLFIIHLFLIQINIGDKWCSYNYTGYSMKYWFNIGIYIDLLIFQANHIDIT